MAPGRVQIVLALADDIFCGLALPRIQLQNGSQIRSRKLADGNRSPAIWSVTGMGPMVRSSFDDFAQWAFVIDQRRRARPGRMDIVRGSSARSDAIVSTMSSYLASGIFGIYFDLTQATTIKTGRTCH